jgi:hypothetical protein
MTPLPPSQQSGSAVDWCGLYGRERDTNERLLALVAHAVAAADWEPGDAQRALRDLRADVAALTGRGPS